MATRQADHDHEDSRASRPAGKLSKKKLRKQRKRDKRQRELEESAARMGFLDDLAEIQASRDEIQNENEDEDDLQHDFSKQLAEDPELEAELRAVEKELAEAYPEKPGQTSDDEDDTQQETLS